MLKPRRFTATARLLSMAQCAYAAMARPARIITTRAIMSNNDWLP